MASSANALRGFHEREDSFVIKNLSIFVIKIDKKKNSAAVITETRSLHCQSPGHICCSSEFLRSQPLHISWTGSGGTAYPATQQQGNS